MKTTQPNKRPSFNLWMRFVRFNNYLNSKNK